jgi:acetyl esterase/lipase
VIPKQNRTHIQTGDVGRICPQATPIWEDDIEPAFILSLLYNTTFTKSTNISEYPYEPAKMDPRTTEDCLFLDVVVPQKIFDRAKQYKSFVPKHKLAPVLVWIYGGGYVGGEKSSNNPTGLIERSQVLGDGIVYVALNYRVSLKLGVSQILNRHLILALPLARRIRLAFR